MIVDTSALVAILRKENGFETYFEALVQAENVALSSVSYLETGILFTTRYAAKGLAGFESFIDVLQIETVAFTQEHARLAISAYQKYGRGNHRAALNFGDCAAYALAIERDDVLLYKGNDFSHTDVRDAIR